MAGYGNNITVRGCVFENIGGCAWSKELEIRFGNGFEIWHKGNDILIENYTFKIDATAADLVAFANLQEYGVKSALTVNADGTVTVTASERPVLVLTK